MKGEIKKYEYEFEDLGPKGMSFDPDTEVSKKAAVRYVTEPNDYVSTIYLNREGCLYLAEMLIKMGLGNYPDGFHDEIREDFQYGDNNFIFRIALDPDLKKKPYLP